MIKTPDQLFRALEINIPSTPITLKYRIAILCVAIFMLLIPLALFALVVCSVWFMYIFTVYGTSELLTTLKETQSGKTAAMIVTAHISVYLAFGAVIFFVAKPLFTGWGRSTPNFEIDPTKEKLLFTFVTRLCNIVGAEPPERIFVDCNVNASASPNYGVFGAILGNHKYNLTIGLPLVAGLRTDQFAGVLAHEFGHFTQDVAFRLMTVIHKIFNWLVQVVYRRDSVDDFFYNAVRTGVVYLMLPGLMVLAVTKIVRTILWLLMMAGHLACMYLLRQQEFDADTYEIRLVGTDQFIECARRITELSIAYNKTEYDFGNMLANLELTDNIPALVAANSRILNNHITGWADEAIKKDEKTSWFSTHPSMQDRNAAAKLLNASAMFDCEMPASVLFSNFRELCMALTRHYFFNELGLASDAFSMISAEKKGAELLAEHKNNEAYKKYFMEIFPLESGIRFENAALEASSTPKEDMARLVKYPEALKRIKDSLKEKYDKIDSLFESEEWCRVILFMYENTTRINWKLFPPQLKVKNKQQMLEKHKEILATIAADRKELATWYFHQAKRLYTGLALYVYRYQKTSDEKENPKVKRIKVLYKIYNKLTQRLSKIWSIITKVKFIQGLASTEEMIRMTNRKPPNFLVKKINSEVADLGNEICDFISFLKTLPYPFAKNGKSISFAEKFVPEPEQLKVETEMFHASAGCIFGVYECYSKILLELVVAANEIEEILKKNN